MTKNKLFRILLFILIIAWTYIWAVNLKRNISNHLQSTLNLCGRSLDEKWSWLLGKELYLLLVNAKKLILPGEKIYFIHNLQDPARGLANYLLYPRPHSEAGDFVIVYKQSLNSAGPGNILYAQGPDTFIIRRRSR